MPRCGTRSASPSLPDSTLSGSHATRTHFRFEQDRRRRARSRAHYPGLGDHLHRRHRARTARGGDRDARRCRRHRLSGDARRAREDAAPGGARRAARAPRSAGAHGGARRARHRADRSRRGESLSIPRDCGAHGRARRRGDREHRHWRPLDAPLGREKLRIGVRGGRSGRLRESDRRRWTPAPTIWICDACSRRRRTRTRRRTTRRSPAGSRGSATSDSRSGCRSRSSAQQSLRYGENPGQEAAFYVEHRGAGLASLVQRGGKELSFNNLLDLEGALLATDMLGDGAPCCAIIKHTSPCGLAVAPTALEAYQKALACDPASAFGSVISFNVPVDEKLADVISEPVRRVPGRAGVQREALEILGRKKNLRMLEGRARVAARARSTSSACAAACSCRTVRRSITACRAGTW